MYFRIFASNILFIIFNSLIRNLYQIYSNCCFFINLQSNSDIQEDMLLPMTIKKTTICKLEADILAQHITNRDQVTSGHIAANPGIECLWEDERQRRHKKADTSEIKHPLELSRTDVEPTKSHLFFKQALRERLAVFSTKNNVVNKLNSSGKAILLLIFQ